jgi:hypothetical protein
MLGQVQCSPDAKTKQSIVPESADAEPSATQKAVKPQTRASTDVGQSAGKAPVSEKRGATPMKSHAPHKQGVGPMRDQSQQRCASTVADVEPSADVHQRAT